MQAPRPMARASPACFRGQMGEDGDLHRCLDVLACIEARGQDLDQDDAHQADAVGHQGLARHLQVQGTEGTVLEQGGQQGYRQHPQAHGGGGRQQQGHAQAPVQQAGILAGIVVGMMLGQGGQQDGTQGHPQHAAGKLHEAVGVIQPGYAAGGEEGGEQGVDEQADLGHGHPPGRPAP